MSASATIGPTRVTAPPRRTTTPVGDLVIAAWVWDDAPSVATRKSAPDGPEATSTPPDPRTPVTPERPTFVLVHGLGASSRYYRPLAMLLAAHGAVHALDLPGFGSAPDPARDLDIADHARAIGEYVRAHGLDRPVLVGHSMGAQIVAELLARDPDVTDSAVLLGPTVEPAAATVRRQALRLLRDQVHETPASVLLTAADTVVRCGAGYYRRQLHHLLDHDMEAAVVAVTADLLVVRGDRDTVAPRGWVHRLAHLAPRGTFLEIPGPHVVMMSEPGRVAEAVMAHVRTGGRRGGT
ncbi:MAG: alpha/beta fold hydrolase [Cellulomonas sp.]